jgi:hypothetical protein
MDEQPLRRTWTPASEIAIALRAAFDQGLLDERNRCAMAPVYGTGAESILLKPIAVARRIRAMRGAKSYAA